MINLKSIESGLTDWRGAGRGDEELLLSGRRLEEALLRLGRAVDLDEVAVDGVLTHHLQVQGPPGRGRLASGAEVYSHSSEGPAQVSNIKPDPIRTSF